MYSQLFALQEGIFKVMANEKRLEILLLLQKGELNVGEMTAMLDLRQANLSQNLALLRAHGLVDVTKKGREVYYRLADESIVSSIEAIYVFLQKKHGLGPITSSASPFPFVTDPICGMRMSQADAYDAVEKPDGTSVYFCASGCKAQYLAKHA